MRSFVVLLALVAICHTNQSCDSCKSMVQSFIDASTNHAKMVEMKVAVLAMCQGTWHQADCERTVDKLDFIARKLAPYLKDTEAVCSKFAMCSDDSSTFSSVSRFAMLFFKKSQSDVANDNIMRQQVCNECKNSIAEWRDYVANEETVAMAKSIVEKFVCKSSGKYESTCRHVASIVVPEIVAAIREVLDTNEQVCGGMQLCSGVAAKQQHVATIATKPLHQVWESLRDEQGQELMSCFECTLSVDALLEEFINKRQATADDLQPVVCDKVVANWTDGCNDFFHMYLSTVLYLTYNQADGRAVCTMMHTCEPKKDFSASHLLVGQKPQIGCEKCAFYEQFLAENAAHLEQHVTNALNSNLCQKLPTSLAALCSQSAQQISGRVFGKLSQLTKSKVLCSQVC